MKKLSTLLVALAATFALAACSNDDYYEPAPPPYTDPFTQQLSEAEKAMVGSYVSDDGQEHSIYLVLSESRAGSYTANGQTSTFKWCLDGSELYLEFADNTGESYPVSYDASGRLCLETADGYIIPFVAYNDGQASDDVLVGQWQGKLGDAFYKDVYGFDDATDLATIFEFAADGTGAQLDYNKFSATTDFSANTFTWVRNGNTISLSYDDNDNGWTSANIDGPSITSAQFTGSVSYTGFAPYKLSMAHVEGFDWSPYLYTDATRAGKPQSRLAQLRGKDRHTVSGGTFKR